mmetsp:Transcript_20381/g.26338  ORF Transcript_20381/g.26338 Transcript_20381/m.26338 type:complete len:128 (-) Transcript_20381:283-666(-)|eukprot:CAMPEP_0116058294 /NCGR_PEP_ID=MMETSP0322-20121206/5115_1 /TAXON_ID=163516 /ORGANISM="Leptocylindrus danicus var. apora, Strain B651" /LENGTH=127 /DNA_ID=CAMNT_0003542457 /DNA_START=152 /DNA_END=535 /DNA_ORIENTATION=+
MAGKGKYRKIPINDNGFDSDDDEDDFIQKQIRNQRMQLKKQDEGLEMLSMSASRLGELSMNIHTELEDQNRMLSEMDEDLERAEGDLDLVTKKTKELVKKAGGTKNCLLILSLIIVVIVLFFLILYT